MQTPEILGIIAGNGVYPRELALAARKSGVKKIVAAAFTGETDPAISEQVDLVEWLRVGQLGRLLKFFREHKVRRAIMIKVAKPNQDMRFDVPVVGIETIKVATEAKLRVIAVEAGKTLLLERAEVVDLAQRARISIVAR